MTRRPTGQSADPAPEPPLPAVVPLPATPPGDSPRAAFLSHPVPWGTVHVAAGDHGVLALEIAGTAADFRERLARRLGGPVRLAGPGTPPAWQATLAMATRQLDEYLAGRRTRFDVPVDLEGLSPWDLRVLDAARHLGYGEVTTYAGLARAIGRPGAARAVGGSLGRNPVPVVIPCHRIVASDGTLGGYGGRGNGSRSQLLAVKRSLLALEAARAAG